MCLVCRWHETGKKHDLEKISVNKGGESEGGNGITRQIRPRTKDCLKQMTWLHLLLSLLNDDGPIRPVQKGEKNRWRGLILTTEEISEIEDKGLALSRGNPGISFLTHLAVLSLSNTNTHTHALTATEWLYSALGVLLGSQTYEHILELKQTPIQTMFK